MSFVAGTNALVDEASRLLVLRNSNRPLYGFGPNLAVALFDQASKGYRSILYQQLQKSDSG